MKRNEESQLESLAKVVHGGLFAGHILGVVYNIEKRRYLHAALHAAVATYDLLSATKHLRRERYLDMDKIREGL